MLYQAPKQRPWPASLPRPSTDQIASAVSTAMRITGDRIFYEHNRSATHVIARRMFGLLAVRIRGMSTPEVADVLGVASHTSFVRDNRSQVSEFCRSAAGTAMYNEIGRALEIEVEESYKPLTFREATREALAGHAGGVV